MRGNLRIAGIPVVLAVILLMVQILGCGKDPIASSNPDYTFNTRYSSITFGSPSSPQDLISAGVDQTGSGPELSQKWLVLSNGFTVYKTRHFSTTEHLTIDFAYEDLEHNVYERRIEIASLTEIRLRNRDGQSIVEYGYELVNDNTLLYHAQTEIDTLLFEIQRIDDSVQFSVSVNHNSYETGFASVSELQLAIQLYAETHNQLLQADLGSYEQDIIQRFENLISPILGAVSLNQNEDIDAAMYLVSDPGFIMWFKSSGDNALKKCEEACWCSIANLIATVSCPFIETGVAAIICVPAAGISLACDLKNIFDAIF